MDLRDDIDDLLAADERDADTPLSELTGVSDAVAAEYAANRLEDDYVREAVDPGVVDDISGIRAGSGTRLETTMRLATYLSELDVSTTVRIHDVTGVFPVETVGDLLASTASLRVRGPYQSEAVSEFLSAAVEPADVGAGGARELALLRFKSVASTDFDTTPMRDGLPDGLGKYGPYLWDERTFAPQLPADAFEPVRYVGPTVEIDGWERNLLTTADGPERLEESPPLVRTPTGQLIRASLILGSNFADPAVYRDHVRFAHPEPVRSAFSDHQDTRNPSYDVAITFSAPGLPLVYATTRDEGRDSLLVERTLDAVE